LAVILLLRKTARLWNRFVCWIPTRLGIRVTTPACRPAWRPCLSLRLSAISRSRARWCRSAPGVHPSRV